MLKVVRILVVEWETAIRVVALLGRTGLDPKEGINESGAGRLLVAGEKKRAINVASRAQTGGEVNDGSLCVDCE